MSILPSMVDCHAIMMPPTEPDDYTRIVERIIAHGERMTVQRRWVIEVLTHSHAHMTLNEVKQAVEAKQGGTIPEPTVYRILQWLKDLGHISQTDMAEAGVVYQIIGAQRHHHLICLHCGRTIDMPDDTFDALRKSVLDRYGFRARIDHMAIYGWCESCHDTAAQD